MARHLTPTEVLAAFRKWRVPFTVEPGWQTRGNTAGWGEPLVCGCMYHHTGDDASDARDIVVLRDGRPGLSGPLCNFAALDSGRIHIIAAGAANHAGKGDPDTLRTVRAGTTPYDRELRPDVSAADSISIGGNGKFYGWESTYGAGTDLTPNPLQHRVTLLSMAAIIDALASQGDTYPRRTGRVSIGHREWTRAKVDPRAVNMGTARSDISWILAVGPDAAYRWYVTGSKTAPTPPPTAGQAQEATVFYVQIDSPDSAVKAPVIVSDGFTARWMNQAGWKSHKAAIAASTGRTPAAALVPSLDGIAVRWVGPVPPASASSGKPYPIPAGWVQ